MKKFILASDHAGYKIKEAIKKYLESKHLPYEDLGPNGMDSVSYAKFGKKLGKKIHDDPEHLIGFGICGTGLGVSFAVNRFTKVRGARVTSVFDAKLAKQHNNANILLFSGRHQTFEEIKAMIEAYLIAKYEGGRHQIRIDELDKKC